MDTSQIVVPETIKAGFNARTDTYSGMLAYVIYKDKKKVWRKEKSWNAWIDHKIPIKEFKNEPTSGFVINKDVGGVNGHYNWEARIEKIRVYDPRGFEIEITVPNMLFIMQECTSTKGKGLEGEFVYGWQGTSLILMPVDCKYYTESKKYTSFVNEIKAVKAKDLVPGCLYANKAEDKFMYLGKLVFRDHNGNRPKKQYVFFDINSKEPNPTAYSVIWYERNRYKTFSSGFVGKRLTDKPLPEFPDVYERLAKKTFFMANPVSLSVVKYTDENPEPRGWSYNNDTYYEKDGIIYKIFFKENTPAYGSNTENRFSVCLRYVVSIKNDPKENAPILDFSENPAAHAPQDSAADRTYYYYDRYIYAYKNLTKEECMNMRHKLLIAYDNGMVVEKT